KQTKSNNQTSPSKQKHKRKKKNTAATAVDESGEVEVVLDITQDLDAANLKVGSHQTKKSVHLMMSRTISSYHVTHKKPTPLFCDLSATLSIQDLDASVHQLENLVETTAKPSSLSSTSLPSAPLQPGIDTALTQTIVKNTVSKYMSCFESILEAKLGNLPAGPLRESCNQEELEQKLEADSKDQRRDFVKLNDRLDRAMSQFRSSEAGVREELSGLSALILQEPNNPTRKTPPHLPPLPHVPPPRGDNSDSEDDQEPIDKEVQHQLPSAIAKSDWPKFSGRDEYDLVGFCRWMDMARDCNYVDEKVLVLKLMTQLTATVTKKTQKWIFWKAEMWNKWGTLSWKQKVEDAFDADKFLPGDYNPAKWVTRQYNRLQCFAPDLTQESVNFKLMGRMDNEVEYTLRMCDERATHRLEYLHQCFGGYL
ncbi:hypothetical protein PSTT_07758, partial [Puccinia striiformis]